MNAPPVSVAVCSTCGRPLNAKGDCLTCLVRIGFDEPQEEAAAPFTSFDLEIAED